MNLVNYELVRFEESLRHLFFYTELKSEGFHREPRRKTCFSLSGDYGNFDKLVTT